MKFKLSEIYKHLIVKVSGVKNDMEFQSLLLLFEEYMGAKEDEEVEENKKMSDKCIKDLYEQCFHDCEGCPQCINDKEEEDDG